MTDIIKTLYFETITSTNDVVREYDRSWTCALAEEQSAGRGQRGNSWESQKGMNLTLSLLLKPSFLSIEEQFFISKVVSIAVCHALDAIGLSAKIKWPNDIYIGDKKICGILIENDISADKAIKRTIIGIGLNINQTTFLSDAPNPTSCALECGTAVERKRVLRELYGALTRLYALLEEGDRDAITREYNSRLYRLHSPGRYLDASGPFIGTITDVEDSGRLIIRKDDGTTKGYLFKEVSFIIG